MTCVVALDSPTAGGAVIQGLSIASMRDCGHALVAKEGAESTARLASCGSDSGAAAALALQAGERNVAILTPAMRCCYQRGAEAESASVGARFGWKTEVEYEEFPLGLSEDIVRAISAKKNEPEWLLDFRLRAYRRWLTMKEPDWSDNRCALRGPARQSFVHCCMSQAFSPQRALYLAGNRCLTWVVELAGSKLWPGITST